MRNEQAQSTETEAFERRLRAYAAGAGAVAAGLLGLSSPATAEVVFVPAHALLWTGSSPFPIDVEGATAFTLTIQPIPKTTFGYCVGGTFYATAASGAGVLGHGGSNQVAALKFGAVIGPAHQFEGGKQRLAHGVSCRDEGWGESGPFANTKDRFLGLRFELNGHVYYGWAGFSVVFDNGDTAVLTAYAYETEPNTPIYAGQTSDARTESHLLPSNHGAVGTANRQPATLGLLALGAPGLDVWRRKDAPETAPPKA